MTNIHWLQEKRYTNASHADPLCSYDYMSEPYTPNCVSVHVNQGLILQSFLRKCKGKRIFEFGPPKGGLWPIYTEKWGI